MALTRVRISEVIDSGYAVSATDGKLVYDRIATEILKGNRVELSFENTTRLTTAFLNAAVGQLYGEFTPTQIRGALVAPTGAEAWHLNRLKAVTDRAKTFFNDPDRLDRIISEVTNDGSL